MWTSRTLCAVLSALLWSAQTPQGEAEQSQAGSETSRDQAPIDAVFTPPSPETIPSGLRGERIRMGYEIVVHTQQYAKRYVGNKLNCTNCHLDAGLNPNAASFVGLSAQYPEYRARVGRKVTLAQRINECFQRSLNGTPLPPDSSKLKSVIAYIEWLSQNVPRGSTVAWRGISRLSPIRKSDAALGKAVYAKKCFFCHGTDGQGTMAGPPLWGPDSYSIGAEMARVSVAASFIKGNMPRGWGWTVTDNEAFDVAAYINSQPRRDVPGKESDWPNGGKPDDSPY
jgi:thiosulfate dehydrogenase